MPRGSEVVLASVPSPVQTEAAAKRSREGRALRGRRGKEGRQGRGCVPGDQAGDRRSLVGPVMTYRRGRLEGEAGRWGNGGSLVTWCAGRSMGPQDPRKLNPWGPERRKPKTSAREEKGPSTVRSGRPREDGVPRGENGRHRTRGEQANQADSRRGAAGVRGSRRRRRGRDVEDAARPRRGPRRTWHASSPSRRRASFVLDLKSGRSWRLAPIKPMSSLGGRHAHTECRMTRKGCF